MKCRFCGDEINGKHEIIPLARRHYTFYDPDGVPVVGELRGYFALYSSPDGHASEGIIDDCCPQCIRGRASEFARNFTASEKLSDIL